MEIPVFPLNDFVFASRIRFLTKKRIIEMGFFEHAVCLSFITAGAVVVQME